MKRVQKGASGNSFQRVFNIMWIPIVLFGLLM